MSSRKIFSKKRLIQLTPVLLLLGWFVLGMFLLWAREGSWPAWRGLSNGWDWSWWVITRYLKYSFTPVLFFLYILPGFILFVLSWYYWLSDSSLHRFAIMLACSFPLFGAYMLIIAVCAGPSIRAALLFMYLGLPVSLLLYVALLAVCLSWRKRQPVSTPAPAAIVLSSIFILLVLFIMIFLIRG